MKRSFLMSMMTAVVLLLALAPAAPAMRASGSTPNVGYADPAAAEMAEIAAYVEAVRPAYAELTECACCCATLDLPSHRCAACRTAAADIERIVARIQRVQTELSRLDVPASLVTAHGELVSAASTMCISGEYMAAAVLKAPRTLVVGERVLMGAPSGQPIVWRPAERIVTDAHIEALAQARPAGLSRSRFLQERCSPFTEEWQATPTGSPGEQAAAYLAHWRDEVAAQARLAGVGLPSAPTG